MKTLILGLGNPIVGDDAIGIIVVEWLEKTVKLPNTTVNSDVSLSGIGLIEQFRGYDQIIIVDSMVTEKYPPGTVKLLSPDQFLSTHHTSDFHNMDFLTALEISEGTFADLPQRENIKIIGIEIIPTQEFSDMLSSEIQNQLETIKNTVKSEVMANVV